VLYSSGEPFPMCLAACYWASISRIVFAATSHDLAEYDFQDLAIYTELRLPAEGRSMREDEGGSSRATRWPGPVSRSRPLVSSR
jgi:guanine deaminase